MYSNIQTNTYMYNTHTHTHGNPPSETKLTFIIALDVILNSVALSLTAFNFPAASTESSICSNSDNVFCSALPCLAMRSLHVLRSSNLEAKVRTNNCSSFLSGCCRSSSSLSESRTRTVAVRQEKEKEERKGRGGWGEGKGGWWLGVGWGGGGGGASKERLVQWKEIAHSTSETFTSTSTVKQNPMATGPRSGNNSKHPAFSLVQWKETACSTCETFVSTSRTVAFSSTVQQSPWWKDKRPHGGNNTLFHFCPGRSEPVQVTGYIIHIKIQELHPPPPSPPHLF